MTELRHSVNASGNLIVAVQHHYSVTDVVLQVLSQWSGPHCIEAGALRLLSSSMVHVASHASGVQGRASPSLGPAVASLSLFLSLSLSHSLCEVCFVRVSLPPMHPVNVFFGPSRPAARPRSVRPACFAHVALGGFLVILEAFVWVEGCGESRVWAFWLCSDQSPSISNLQVKGSREVHERIM